MDDPFQPIRAADRLGCNRLSVAPALLSLSLRAKKLGEGKGGRPGLPVSNSPYDLCGRKATLKRNGR